MHKFPLPFARTRCDCPECSQFCSLMPGYLVPWDIQNLCPNPLLIRVWAETHLRASPGAIVFIHGGQERIKTLVPAIKPDGSCIYLKEDGKCEQHEIAPFGCAFFDCHMGKADYTQRVSVGLRLIRDDWEQNGPYSRLWTTLDRQGIRSKCPSELRKELAQRNTNNA